MNELSENARVILGAFALADVHTLQATDVVDMANGSLCIGVVTAALEELTATAYAEVAEEGAYRLTRTGIEVTLRLQDALKPGA